MEDQKRSILARVASGDLSPEEGAARLEELEAGEPEASSTTFDAPAPELPAASELSSVRVSSEFGSVLILGDASVREALADGAHSVRREGDRMLIVHSIGSEIGGFSFGRHSFRRHGDRLTVRVNPRIPLEVESQAGSVQIREMEGAIQVSVQAGSTTIDGFRGPLKLSSQAGSIRARGRLTGGESRIDCQAGSVRLELASDSSVRIKARSQMGRIRIGTDDRHDRVGLGTADEYVVGDGRALLNIDTTMGSVRVEFS